MIHHLSIPAREPLHVARVLVDLFDGHLTGFGPFELSRGSFDVIEFWIENRVMLELMTRDMTADYLRATRASG